MSLDAALGIASGSLANISLGIGVVSQNVANASTPGYAVESAPQQSVEAGGVGIGVRSAPVIRATDAALQGELQGQTAQSAYWQTTSASLATIQPALGTVGAGTDLTSQLAALQGAFSSLLNDPGDQTQQGAVVDSAETVAQGIDSLSGTYAQARQGAQDDLVANVGSLNAALGTIGTLSDQIVTLQSQGLSTADLESQRDVATAAVSQLVDANFVTQPNGDLLVFTKGGAQLPTHVPDPLSITSATAGATAYYPGGGLGGITLGGTDITGQLGGGQIAANLALRDTTIPTYQASLDEYAQNLASRFDAQGLTLFTDPQGAVPSSTGPATQTGYVGFASTITVNPQVVADPALVRDGTHAVAGSPTGASAFAPNPQGLAGFTDTITRVLDYALGTDVQQGIPQTPGATTGLGPSGTLSAGFGAQASLGDFASALTASQAQDSASATAQSSDSAALQTTLQGKLTGETGVDLDTELTHMVQLQNAYGANAKIITAAQAMLTQMLDAVQ
jgi:flagellar hook-associated protein 1 FlgK